MGASSGRRRRLLRKAYVIAGKCGSAERLFTFGDESFVPSLTGRAFRESPAEHHFRGQRHWPPEWLSVSMNAARKLSLSPSMAPSGHNRCSHCWSFASAGVVQPVTPESRAIAIPSVRQAGRQAGKVRAVHVLGRVRAHSEFIRSDHSSRCGSVAECLLELGQATNEWGDTSSTTWRWLVR